MNQQTFSQKVKEYLEKDFPEFIPTIKYLKDESFESELKNPAGKFSIYIATYNCEITIGLTAPNGNSDIHTHIYCYEDLDLSESFSRASKLINEILNNEMIIYLNDKKVYDWIKYDQLIEKEKKNGNQYEKYFWN